MEKLKIDYDLLKRTAPMYFSNVVYHLEMMRKMANFTGKYLEVRIQIEEFMRLSGMSAADAIFEYDDSMLKNDEFRMNVIMYTCISLIVLWNSEFFGFDSMCISSDAQESILQSILGPSGESLTMNEFRGFVSSFQNLIGTSFTPNDAIRYFTKVFDISQDIIPEYVKKNLVIDSEERNANEICESKIEKLDGPSNYVDFDQYYEYIEENTKPIISILNTEGFINTYPIDVMTNLVLLKKLRFQIGKIYDVENSLPIPAEVLGALARKIFHATKGGLNGDIIGPDDLGGN